MRKELDVDLLETTTFQKLLVDWVLLAQVVYVLCADQVRELSVTEEQFGRALAGEAIDAATEALLQALLDFFPPRKRELLRQVLTKARQMEKISADHAETILSGDRLEQLLRTKLAELDRQLEATLSGSSSGRPPASSASIPSG